MPQEKIALLGFGDIANRLASHFVDEEVVGVKRSPITHDSVNIETANCANSTDMDRVMQKGFDVIVMTFTPQEMSEQGYQTAYVDTVKAVLAAIQKQSHQPRLILFVSSTSVYGQRDGSWINEQTPAEPEGYGGRCLLQAEQLLANSGYPYCCVRFSGIYGPGRRRLIDQVIEGKGSPEEPKTYSNRIHADDCAGVLAHLIGRQKQQEIDNIYIATDCEPVPLYDVKQWIAQELLLPADHFADEDDKRKRAPRSNKRCSNQRLLSSGYQFLYPTYREGYRALIEELT